MALLTKLTSVLLFATSALAGIAALPRAEGNTIKQVVHRRIPAPVQATATRDIMPAACTSGLSASKQHPAGYPITDYTMVTPDATNWTSYALKQDWYGNHFVSGPHVSGVFCCSLLDTGQRLMLEGRSWASPTRAIRTARSSVSTPATPMRTATRTLFGTVRDASSPSSGGRAKLTLLTENVGTIDEHLNCVLFDAV